MDLSDLGKARDQIQHGNMSTFPPTKLPTVTNAKFGALHDVITAVSAIGVFSNSITIVYGSINVLDTTIIVTLS